MNVMSSVDPVIYEDRAAAGEALAEHLREFKGRAGAVILALPRGGVPVAAAAARLLRLPMDVFLVRKLGVPGYEELAMGAIASGGVRVLNENVLERITNPADAVERVTARELKELERREQAYRGGRAAVSLTDKTVIVMDDGLATGATMRAAVQAIRQRGAARCIAAVPVGSAEACELLRLEGCRVVCPAAPDPFEGVGRFYADFGQVSDDEVRAALVLSPAHDAQSGN